MFPPSWRRASLDSLEDGYDLVVIGGGITGCGVALDAAQRGLGVLLVERGDIASGTSSRSSKLIHGGLRYLKQMQFRITRLACRERDRMLRLSPHLVHPVRFLYPASHGDRTPGWQIDLGLWMYDRLTARPEKHAQLELEEVVALVPDLPTEGLDRVLAYTDVKEKSRVLTSQNAPVPGLSCDVPPDRLRTRSRIGGRTVVDDDDLEGARPVLVQD